MSRFERVRTTLASQQMSTPLGPSYAVRSAAIIHFGEGNAAEQLVRVLQEELPGLRSVDAALPVELEVVCQRAMAWQSTEIVWRNRRFRR